MKFSTFSLAVLLAFFSLPALSQAINNNQPDEDTRLVMDILKLHASKTQGLGCPRHQGEWRLLDEQEERAVNAFKLGDYHSAMGMSVVAKILADCAIKNQGKSEYVERTGLALGFYAITSLRHYKMMNSAIALDGRHAIVLLKATGSTAAATMLKSLQNNEFGDPDDRAAKSLEQPAISASTKELAERYSTNSLGFTQKYTGKTIATKGPVRSVGELLRNGKKPGAYIILSGVNKPRDELTFRDEVQCEATDPKSVERASELRAKQTISVRGVFDPKRSPIFETGVVLHDCVID